MTKGPHPVMGGQSRQLAEFIELKKKINEVCACEYPLGKLRERYSLVLFIPVIPKGICSWDFWRRGSGVTAAHEWV